MTGITLERAPSELVSSASSSPKHRSGLAPRAASVSIISIVPEAEPPELKSMSTSKRENSRGGPFLAGRISGDLMKVLLTVCCGLSFTGVIYLVHHSRQRTLEYLTAYVVELSLSVDNLFVFLLIFNFFQVPRDAQEPVLFWGILGAMVFRGCMIVLGEQLVAKFAATQLLFAAVLIYSSLKLIFGADDDEEDLSSNRIVRLARSCFNVSERYHGRQFYSLDGGKRVWTPLVVVLVTIELSDVVFALDSVPAVLGISDDMFVIYTSNIFAILGLRSMYFVIADAIGNLRFLKPSLALVLGFIGLKMVASVFGAHLGVEISLFVVVGTICGGIALSYIFPTEESADIKEQA